MSGSLLCSLFQLSLSGVKSNVANLRSIHTSSLYYAARKGTRERARAKKVKVEVTKVGFVPKSKKAKDKLDLKAKVDKHLDDTFKQIPTDDVFPMKYYRWVIYSVEDAVKFFQETHHPTMFNQPDAFVFANIEMNMEAVKKNRFVDDFTKLTLLPHNFPRDEQRSIMAFCKTPEIQKEARDAGALMVGATDIIKKVQDGEIKAADYEYIIAHPNIITDLVPIRGLLKRKFPNVKNGTLAANIGDMVKKFSAGIQYKVLKDEIQQNFGSVQVPIGRLNMDPKQIAKNVETLLKDLQAGRPKRDGKFITRCFIESPPVTMKLKIDPFVFIDETLSKEVTEDSDDEAEVPVAAAQ